MNKELSEEIFRLSIELQNITNRQWEIQKSLGKITASGFKDIPLWPEVCTLAMREKMGMTADQIIEEARR